MPLSTRVWRTSINWLDANRIGMTFAFLFGPAALTFSLWSDGGEPARAI